MPRRIRPPVGITVTDGDLRAGIVRDSPRIAIPGGGVYDAVDFLLDHPGVARKRGGTFWAGPALTDASHTIGVAFAPFPDGTKLVAVGDNGHIYTVTSTATTDVGGSTITNMRDKPKLRVGANNVLVFPNGDGVTAPVAYAGSGAAAALGGSPPAGRYAEVYKTRVVLGGNDANPNRMYFSPTPDIEDTWDTSTSWIDSSYQITGFAALQSALLVFSETHVERLIGTTPPPGSDMDLAPILSLGCTDARSIVVQNDQCIFANPAGVYLTNGAAARSLTAEGNIESYWQSLFTSYDVSSWTISSGLFGNYLFMSISDTSGTLVQSLMCYLPRRSWTRLSNINARMWANSSIAQGQATGGTELYYADRQAPRVTAMSSVFVPSAAYENDANGTAVQPSLEYKPVVGYGSGLKAYGMGRLTYDMRAGSGTPTLAVTVKTGVEADRSHTPADSPLAATTSVDRVRFSAGYDSTALTVRLDQSGASSKTEVYALEVEARDYGYYDQTHDGVGDG